MVQWINFLRNNNFVNASWLAVLYEKTGAVALAQLGLTIDRQTKCCYIWRFLELYTGRNIKNLAAFRKIHCHYSGTNTF